jgi:aryl-alcohol dehydrogenase-like predicted oxidoreductase
MERTLIQRTGKSVSAIGLGCVTFGREIDQPASFELMNFALEQGITFFDTSPSYGAGASEKIVGRWLSDHRHAQESILIATKIQPPYTPKHIFDSIIQSLKNLQTESIDLLYLHRYADGVENPAVLKALNTLIRSGKVKLIGVSNFNAMQLKILLDIQIDRGFECVGSIQNNNNLAVSDIDEEILQICLAHDIKIVTYSPLGAGFLTGKYTKGVEGGSRFDLIKAHQGIYFNKIAFHRLSKLQAISHRTGFTLSHLACAWALHQPWVASVLVGGRNTDQIHKALEAMNFDDADILDALNSI